VTADRRGLYRWRCPLPGWLQKLRDITASGLSRSAVYTALETLSAFSAAMGNDWPPVGVGCPSVIVAFLKSTVIVP